MKNTNVKCLLDNIKNLKDDAGIYYVYYINNKFIYFNVNCFELVYNLSNKYYEIRCVLDPEISNSGDVTVKEAKEQLKDYLDADFENCGLIDKNYIINGYDYKRAKQCSYDEMDLLIYTKEFKEKINGLI